MSLGVDHVVEIERGTGERIVCHPGKVCAGAGPSGVRLVNRIVSASQIFAHAARRLLRTDAARRPVDGTLVVADVLPVSHALRLLPRTPGGTTDLAILFAILKDRPDHALSLIANNPYGYMNLLTQIRKGRYGAGDLIDAPFPTVAVAGTIVVVLAGATWLMWR